MYALTSPKTHYVLQKSLMILQSVFLRSYVTPHK